MFHDLFENFGDVPWRITVFYKADLDLQLQLIADVLIVQPVSKRRFGIDDLFDLLRQSLALIVDDNTVFCKNEGSSQRRTEYFLL